jgi:hypothetical protein
MVRSHRATGAKPRTRTYPDCSDDRFEQLPKSARGTHTNLDRSLVRAGIADSGSLSFQINSRSQGCNRSARRTGSGWDWH